MVAKFRQLMQAWSSEKAGVVATLIDYEESVIENFNLHCAFTLAKPIEPPLRNSSKDSKKEALSAKPLLGLCLALLLLPLLLFR